MKLTALLSLTALMGFAQPLPELKRQFLDPPPDSRVMMRWWWFGPAVTHQQLEREMRLMKEGGIGGFEVQPVYPLALDDPSKGFRNLPFLSDEYLDALRFTARKAKEFGLRMDLTLGSGWPFGGPQIPLEQAAGRLRVQKGRGSQPVQLREGESLIGTFDASTNKEVAPGAALPDEVIHFISSHTRQMVKRASVGAEGYVLNHYDRSALDNYLKTVGDRLMEAFPGDRPHAIFCDSLESFGSDWAPGVFDEFRKRRGYDLRPYLPALVTDIGPKTAAVRHDWGQTLTDMLHDNFLAPMQKWSKSNRTLFRIQDYGIPPAILSSNVYADIPEGEGSQWRVVRASRWASSASHLYGRPVTTSETWTWLHSPVFRATPLDIKAEADIHFIQGINQLIGHGWPYTAEGVEYPGWRFYASGVFNDKNPWWIVMPDLAKYLQRVSFLMRQGQPANDVALYLPNSDAWSHFTAGRNHMIEQLRELVGPEVIPQIVDSGYGFDFVDDGTLDRLNSRHRVIVLPAVERMPPATAAKLQRFAQQGGTVIATRRKPDSAPGLNASDADHATVRALAAKVKLAPADSDLGAALRTALTPDLAISPASKEIGFIHRITDSADIYFIANTGNKRQQLTAAFRVGDRTPELWDPHTGNTAGVPVLSRATATVTVALDLEPYASRTVVFSRTAAKPIPIRPPDRTIDLSTGWTVRFGDRPARPFETLASWTADERTRFYSGTATYERSFDHRGGGAVTLYLGEGTPIPPRAEPRGGPGMRAWFDGPVREAAVVYVNGKRAGSVWCPPYELDIAKFVRPGKNDLRIVVANLAVNHMAGGPLPDYKELHAKYGRRFDPQDMEGIQPIPSGLLGPVQLRIASQN